MNLINNNKIPIIIAITQWLLTLVFKIDKYFFEYTKITDYWIITKILYLIFLLILWCFIFNTYRKIKLGDKNYKRAWSIFKFYLFMMIILLIILWPGVWSWDDIWTLDAIHRYQSWDPYQHILTGIYQSILLQILPFPGGIILLQNIIISVCVAFVVTKLEATYKIKIIKNKLLDLLIKLLPFCLPPVLIYQFSGYRIGLYIYIELTMLVMLICASKDKTKWSKQYIGLFCFLCIIAASWRSESFFYIPFVCLIILCMKKEIISRLAKVICILIICIGFAGIVRLQNFLFSSKDYSLLSLVNQCVEVVRAADYIEDAKELSDIDKIFKLDIIYNNPKIKGLDIYYTIQEFKRDEYTKKDYVDMCNALIKLIMKYPKDVLAERFNLFIHSSGINQKAFSNGYVSATFFDEENSDNSDIATLVEGKIAGMPIFKDARKDFINFLEIKTRDGAYIETIRRLIWNTIIPTLILIYAWIKSLINRNWYLLAICTPVLIKLIVVILTQPSAWFMYFLSFYLLGYVYFIYKLLIVISRKKVIINS